MGEKLKAYNLQDLGSDTVQANLLLRHPADARSYGLATAMLADLSLQDIRLLTNNPDKIRAVEGPNREVVVKERVAMVPKSWKHQGDGFTSPEVNGYLKTKVRDAPPSIGLQSSNTDVTADRENGPHVRHGSHSAVRWNSLYISATSIWEYSGVARLDCPRDMEIVHDAFCCEGLPRM